MSKGERTGHVGSAQQDLALGREAVIDEQPTLDGESFRVHGDAAGVGKPGSAERTPASDPGVLHAQLAAGPKTMAAHQPALDDDPLGGETEAACASDPRAVEGHHPADPGAREAYLAVDDGVRTQKITLDVQALGMYGRICVDLRVAEVHRSGHLCPGQVNRAVHHAAFQAQAPADHGICGLQSGQPGTREVDQAGAGSGEDRRLLELALGQDHRVLNLGVGQVQPAGDPRSGQVQARRLPWKAFLSAEQHPCDDRGPDGGAGKIYWTR
ncbi:hypothetical protein [Nonomuraea zeae]|uniref:Uncharacterized protein n=1 Tax=Nonomuraea zeae TaxID=1642303 RepID=A0A5S4FV40_9ACTN|nr:hypothetical protein ETD85_46285 [Nonomuraea zeae]